MEAAFSGGGCRCVGSSNIYLLALLHHEVRTVVAVEVEAKELVQVLCERSARARVCVMRVCVVCVCVCVCVCVAWEGGRRMLEGQY